MNIFDISSQESGFGRCEKEISNKGQVVRGIPTRWKASASWQLMWRGQRQSGRQLKALVSRPQDVVNLEYDFKGSLIVNE